ncbi:hypothetical protein B0I27_11724 [Arcticibacter pallidicorallinus]|uniref:Uncharacterized protein n=1 Tax=Arcticibacter pallidicorallinus TaxID=1259464 RepID=A0A2T0TQV5_9SPHI|nr:hypothetical protein B0I27_11724 [Arcticibacter pallidicorallinus]
MQQFFFVPFVIAISKTLLLVDRCNFDYIQTGLPSIALLSRFSFRVEHSEGRREKLIVHFVTHKVK